MAHDDIDPLAVPSVPSHGGGQVVSGQLAAAYAPFGAKVEVLRSVRSRLAQRWFGDDPAHRALAIVSANRHDGRSFVAANLAVVFSQSERRTLLIDGDLHNPMLHRLFGLPEGSGLTELLSGHTGSELIRPAAGIPYLHVLCAGVAQSHSADLLARPSFVRFLREAAANYDCILVDTPAAADSSDAQTIAAATGAALVVALKNVTRVAQIRSLSESLVDVGAKVVGSLLNEY